MDSIGQILLVILVFILMIIGSTYAIGKKIESLVRVLKEGAKLEFTTKSGWYSLAVVVVVGIVGLVIILTAEIKSILFALLRLPSYENGEAVFIAVFCVLIVALADFVVITSLPKG